VAGYDYGEKIMATLPRFRHALGQVASRNSVTSRRRGRIITKFAEKIGLVYFGTVDSHVDEHHIIRGLTISGSHRDTHYSIGSYEGYDIGLVERTDLVGPSDNPKSYRFLVLEFRLHTKRDIPHIVLTPKGIEDALLAYQLSLHSSLQLAPLGALQTYSPEFLHRFSAYSVPTHFIELERLFTSDVTRYIAAHFWPLTVEVQDGALYLSSIHPVVTGQLLETILQNGLWLADKIDNVVE
jgi:hypothetical protein